MCHMTHARMRPLSSTLPLADLLIKSSFSFRRPVQLLPELHHRPVSLPPVLAAPFKTTLATTVLRTSSFIRGDTHFLHIPALAALLSPKFPSMLGVRALPCHRR